MTLDAEWLDLRPVKFPGKWGNEVEDFINAYYMAYPDHVLGEWAQNELVYSPDAGVRRRAGDDRPVAEMLRALIGRLPAGIMGVGGVAGADGHAAGGPSQAPGRAIGWGGDLAPSTPQEHALGRVLRASRAVLGAAERGEDGAGARRVLGAAYAAYRAKHGEVRAAERSAAHPLHRLTHSRWWSLVACLETDAGARTGVFSGPTVTSRSQSQPATAIDAVYQLMDEVGSFSPEAVAERMNGGAT